MTRITQKSNGKARKRRRRKEIQFTLKERDDFVGLILFCVAKHGESSTVSHWDMLQSGWVGLAKALQTYDGRCPLKNWVYRIVNSTIIKCRYKSNKPLKEFSGYDDNIFTQVEANHNDIPTNAIIRSEIAQDQLKQQKRAMTYLYGKHPYLKQDRGLNRRIYVDRVLKNQPIKVLVQKYNLSYDMIMKRLSKVNQILKEKMIKYNRRKQYANESR